MTQSLLDKAAEEFDMFELQSSLLSTMDKVSAVQQLVGPFGPYQIRTAFVTQIGYLAVTGSLLTALYDTRKPYDDFACDNTTAAGYDSSAVNSSDFEYRSLLFDLELLCAHSYVPTLFNTITMLGGVLGSVSYGFLADKFGRKRTLLAAMTILGVCHGLLAAFGALQWIVALVICFVLGFQAGGYMVVNIVLMLECIGDQKWRLGMVAFNGWPAGLMLMGGIGYVTRYWLYYHIVYTCQAALFALLIMVFCDESARWLYQHERFGEAIDIWLKTARVNGQSTVDKKRLESIVFGGQQQQAPASPVHDRTYYYSDLLKNRQTVKYLFALFYSWLSSAIMSFALYSLIGSVVGNPFFNHAVTGLFKGITGVIPFFVAGCVGRKTILLTAVTATTVAVWAAVAVYFASEQGSSAQATLLIVFSVAGAAAIDPIWKVNHLYSTELFPTVVRNMARAICNLGSRSGSLIGPQIAYLGDTVHPALPFGIFGVLSFVQLLIASIMLPETKGKKMPEALMDRLEDESSAQPFVDAVQLNDVQAWTPPTTDDKPQAAQPSTTLAPPVNA